MILPISNEHLRSEMRELLAKRERGALNKTAILDLMVEAYTKGSDDTAAYLETGKVKR